MIDRLRVLTAWALQILGFKLEVFGGWLQQVSERIDLPFPPVSPSIREANITEYVFEMYDSGRKIGKTRFQNEYDQKTCPTCQVHPQETVNLVCQICGRDYMLDDPKPTKRFY